MFGLGVDVYYLIKKDLKINISLALCFGVLIIIYLFYFLSNTRYFHYDNFSHWGLIVKNIYQNSRFPNFQDAIIGFQSYPTGSASFIWYICKIVGYSEGHTLFAQAILILSCTFPFWERCKGVESKKKWLILSIVIVESLFWMTYGAHLANGLYQLLVDVLLAAVAVAAFSIVYYYQEDVKRALACVVPLLSFEVCIKNSGVMWVIAILMELLYFCARSKIKKGFSIFIFGGALGIPLMFRLLWDRHIALVFSNSESSSHAMSLKNWKGVFAEKTQNDLLEITQLFLGQILSVKSTVLHLLIAMLIVVCILITINRSIIKQLHILYGFFFLVIVTVIYQIGNYFMYLFSMPLGEALRLAGYSRYVMTLECFVMGVITVFGLELIRGENMQTQNVIQRYGHIFSGMVLFLFLLIKSVCIKDLIIYVEPQKGREVSRWRLDDIVEKYGLEEGKKSLIYMGDPNLDRDVGYRFLMSKFVLYSNDIRVINSDQVNELKNANDYDYTIILEQDDIVDAWLGDSVIPFENNECLKLENYDYVTLQEYLQMIDNDRCIVFISVKDDAATMFNNGMKVAMAELGLQIDITGRYRYSYCAIVDEGTVIYENLNEDLIEISGKYKEIDYSIKSAGFSCGNLSSIVINGKDYSRNMRGINIVIYDKECKKVIDAINFDTWQLDGAYMIKK